MHGYDPPASKISTGRDQREKHGRMTAPSTVPLGVRTRAPTNPHGKGKRTLVQLYVYVHPVPLLSSLTRRQLGKYASTCPLCFRILDISHNIGAAVETCEMCLAGTRAINRPRQVFATVIGRAHFRIIDQQHSNTFSMPVLASQHEGR